MHDDAYQLLAATILSAQTTDENVNKVTPQLFARYPTPRDLAHADPEAVEAIVHSTGFFRSKTKSLLGMARCPVHKARRNGMRSSSRLTRRAGLRET